MHENFEKDALFQDGIEKWQKIMSIAVLSQGLFNHVEMVNNPRL